MPAKIACCRNLALASPLRTLSMNSYMGGPEVTFCPPRLFWTRSQKVNHSSGVPDSNIGILMTYLPEVESPGVL